MLCFVFSGDGGCGAEGKAAALTFPPPGQMVGKEKCPPRKKQEVAQCVGVGQSPAGWAPTHSPTLTPSHKAKKQGRDSPADRARSRWTVPVNATVQTKPVGWGRLGCLSPHRSALCRVPRGV